MQNYRNLDKSVCVNNDNFYRRRCPENVLWLTVVKSVCQRTWGKPPSSSHDSLCIKTLFAVPLCHPNHFPMNFSASVGARNGEAEPQLDAERAVAKGFKRLTLIGKSWGG